MKEIKFLLIDNVTKVCLGGKMTKKEIVYTLTRIHSKEFENGEGMELEDYLETNYETLEEKILYLCNYGNWFITPNYEKYDAKFLDSLNRF